MFFSGPLIVISGLLVVLSFGEIGSHECTLTCSLGGAAEVSLEAGEPDGVVVDAGKLHHDTAPRTTWNTPSCESEGN